MKSICHGNCNAIGLVLLPIAHAGTNQVTVVKNRRALEDRLLQPLAEIVLYKSSQMILFSNHFQPVRSMDGTDIAFQFCDSGHGGDRRKRTQPGILSQKLLQLTVLYHSSSQECCAFPTSTRAMDLQRARLGWASLGPCNVLGSLNFCQMTMRDQQIPNKEFLRDSWSGLPLTLS